MILILDFGLELLWSGCSDRGQTEHHQYVISTQLEKEKLEKILSVKLSDFAVFGLRHTTKERKKERQKETSLFIKFARA